MVAPVQSIRLAWVVVISTSSVPATLLRVAMINGFGSAEAEKLSLRGFLAANWPYLAMLVLSLVGAAYTSVARRESTFYWIGLIPPFAVMCVFARLRSTDSLNSRSSLVWTEALHWGTVLLAVGMLFEPSVRGLMAEEASGVLALLLLALGTLTAGVRIDAWSLGVVGLVLMIGVPIIAWFENAALLIALLAIVIIALGAMFTIFRLRHRG
jgi:hypothetical protein